MSGPLRAKSRRGPIGETWWSRTLVDILERSSIGGRLARGKTYARQGRVLSLAILPGRVEARVQGSEPKPYDVIVTFTLFSPAEIEALTQEIARVPFLVAGLLAGTLPPELNAVAQRLDLGLLPTPRQVGFSCSCPDWGEPCKHASAVTYLTAEHLDTEPFDLLTLHGVDRATLLEEVIAQSELAADDGANAPLPADGAALPDGAAPPESADLADGAAASRGDAQAEGQLPAGGPPSAANHFRAGGPFPVPGPATPPPPRRRRGETREPAGQGANPTALTALDVLDHQILTPRGPSIAFWLAPHYAALTGRGEEPARPEKTPGDQV